MTVGCVSSVMKEYWVSLEFPASSVALTWRVCVPSPAGSTVSYGAPTRVHAPSSHLKYTVDRCASDTEMSTVVPLLCTLFSAGLTRDTVGAVSSVTKS